MEEVDLIGMTIVGGFAVKLSWPSQENVTSFQGNDITLSLYFPMENLMST